MQLEPLIQSIGLPGLILGTIAEGDGVTFFGGVLAHRGLFPFVQVVLACALGAVVIDNMMFLLGRFARDTRYVRHSLTRSPVQRLHLRLNAYPTIAILGFRFLYGMKTAGAVLIGTTDVSWLRFAALNALAVVIWAAVLAGIGYVAGGAIQAAFGRLHLHHHLILAALIGLALVTLFWFIAHTRHKKGKL